MERFTFIGRVGVGAFSALLQVVEWFGGIKPGSFATFRMTTVIGDGDCEKRGRARAGGQPNRRAHQRVRKKKKQISRYARNDKERMAVGGWSAIYCAPTRAHGVRCGLGSGTWRRSFD